MFGGKTRIGLWGYGVLPAGIRGALYAEFALPVFCLALAVLAGLGAQRFARGRTAGMALLAVAALELIAVSSGRPFNTADREREPGISTTAFDGSTELLSGVRALSYQNVPPWRIDTRKGAMNWSNVPMMLRIPTANGTDPFALERLIQVRLAFAKGVRWGRFYEVEQPQSPVVDLLNIRYVLSRDQWEPGLAEHSGFRLKASLPGTVVYENAEALPRFWLLPEVRQVNGMREALAIVRDPSFDARHVAVVEGGPAVSGSAVGSVRVVHYAPRSVDLEVDSPEPAFLATSEVWYPGWQAYVDGREVSLRITNAAFRGLSVPAGRHEVRMAFAPQILLVSALASLLAIGVWIWLVRPTRWRSYWTSHPRL